jgi:hypothetical protein
VITGLALLAYMVASSSDLGGRWVLAIGGIVACGVATSVLLVLWAVQAAGRPDR